ncbi:MAG: methylated-DNA--[protein]-cysteine S-methyltransferase [Cellulosilyticaceae bacterium]
MKTYYYATQEFEIGPITVVVSEQGLEYVFLQNVGWETFLEQQQGELDLGRCQEVMSQLRAYFEGSRQQFDLPLAAKGTAFQEEVWQQLQKIPYGKVCTYGALAKAVQRPGAARAVGAANRANPIPIVVPCHRVIASDGGLGGYMGAYSDLKKWLLDHEQKGTNL